MPSSSDQGPRAPPESLLRLHEAMSRRLGWTAGLAAIALVALGLVALRTRVDSDVTLLLPGGPGSPQEAAKLLSEFGVLDTLLVELAVPGATVDQLVDAGVDVARRLRTAGTFAEVYEGPSAQDIARLGQAYLPRRLYLLDDPAREIEARLAPDRLRASLAAVKTQLASPQAFAMKGAILGDPLGLNAGVFGRLGRAFSSAELYRGHFVSSDRRHLMLIGTPRESALHIDASRALLEAVRSVEASTPPGPEGPARLRAVGGPRFAVESAQAMRHDVIFTFVTSAIGILGIFLLRFRSLRLLFFASVPLVFGVVTAIAAVAVFRGRIHGMTLGFGAALIGISIDYPTHLLNRSDVESGERARRARVGVTDTWESLWLGMATTVLAFAALFISRFPALRELALFAGVGVIAAFAATLLLLPPLYARFGPRPLGAGGSWASALSKLALPRWVAAVLTAVVVVASLLALPSVRFDGELRNLDVQRPETRAEHREVLERFGHTGSDALAVARGATAEEALVRNDAVERALVAEQVSGRVEMLRGIGAFLPSSATQRERAARLAAMDLASARTRLDAAAGELGFATGAFEPFWAEVASVARGAIPPLGPSDLAGTSLAPLVERALRSRAGEWLAVTAFQRSGSAQAPVDLPPGTWVIDGGALAAETMVQIPRQLMLLCGVGLLANFLLLGATYRSLRIAAAACLPCLIGVLATVAILAASGNALNLVSASALVLVLGCGVDYGIFVLQGLMKPPANRPTSVETVGVLIAAVTTLAGFGTLAVADQPAMRSLGLAVGLGIFISGAAALFLLPGLHAALFAPGAARQD